MAYNALTDGAGHSFIDPTSGRMLVIPPPPVLIAAGFTATASLIARITLTGTSLSGVLRASGFFGADATIELSKVPPESGLGQYRPLNAFTRRTTVRKHR